MTQIVAELYNALRAAGVEDDTARAAAQAVIGIEERTTLATKADIATVLTAIAEVKADLTWRIILTLSLQTAVFSGIVAALKFVRP